MPKTKEEASAARGPLRSESLNLHDNAEKMVSGRDRDSEVLGKGLERRTPGRPGRLRAEPSLSSPQSMRRQLELTRTIFFLLGSYYLYCVYTRHTYIEIHIYVCIPLYPPTPTCRGERTVKPVPAPNRSPPASVPQRQTLEFWSVRTASLCSTKAPAVCVAGIWTASATLLSYASFPRLEVLQAFLVGPPPTPPHTAPACPATWLPTQPLLFFPAALALSCELFPNFLGFSALVASSPDPPPSSPLPTPPCFLRIQFQNCLV